MFWFSNKPASKNIEGDYDTHSRQIKALISKKNSILEDYNIHV